MSLSLVLKILKHVWLCVKELVCLSQSSFDVQRLMWISETITESLFRNCVAHHLPWLQKIAPVFPLHNLTMPSFSVSCFLKACVECFTPVVLSLQNAWHSFFPASSTWVWLLICVYSNYGSSHRCLKTVSVRDVLFCLLTVALWYPHQFIIFVSLSADLITSLVWRHQCSLHFNFFYPQIRNTNYFFPSRIVNKMSIILSVPATRGRM